eukprot:TRINITY_DN5098_c0_g1_i4.p2 TRINITY_DN5098_c0_g1~~TRINITY_DN5098_c0_g1_i4.p2  ORF type:complete len:354 (-),score=36.75 TRINITY_DN5098_c0_g1_i4:1732-2793(-)
MIFEWPRDENRIGEIVASYLEDQSSDRGCRPGALVKHFQDTWNTKLRRKNIVRLVEKHPNVFYISQERVYKTKGSVFQGNLSTPTPDTTSNATEVCNLTTSAVIQNNLQIKSQKKDGENALLTSNPPQDETKEEGEKPNEFQSICGLVQQKGVEPVLGQQQVGSEPKGLQELIVGFISQKGGSSSISEVMEYLYMYLKISLPDDLTLRQLVQYCNALRMDGEIIALSEQTIQDKQIEKGNQTPFAQQQSPTEEKQNERVQRKKKIKKKSVKAETNEIIDNEKKLKVETSEFPKSILKTVVLNKLFLLLLFFEVKRLLQYVCKQEYYLKRETKMLQLCCRTFQQWNCCQKNNQK